MKAIVLTGMMGAGKTTIGKALAARLNRVWLDSDQIIEQQTGQTITQIFTEQGEDAFRKIETNTILQILDQAPAGSVISLGGGAFMNKQIRQRCAEKATTIWLQANVDTILKRITSKQTARPLLNNPNHKKIDARQKIENLLEKRTPIYAQADKKIPENNPEYMIKDIVAHVAHL